MYKDIIRFFMIMVVLLLSACDAEQQYNSHYPCNFIFYPQHHPESSLSKVNEHILDNPMYDLMFSVEEVNRLAANGMPFRDAYKKVGLDIEAGNFVPDKNIHHTHEGSIGNLMNDKITALFNSILSDFHFERMEEAEKELLL